MRLLDRYLAGRVIRHAGAAAGVLVLLFVLITLGDELNKLNEHYRSGDAFLVALGQAPRWLYELLPSALLIGLVSATTAMLGRSELVAMQAAGFGLLRQTGVVAVVALVAGLGTVWLYERLAPLSHELISGLKEGQSAGAFVSGDAVWLRDRDSVRLYRGLSEDHIDWLEIYRIEDDRLVAWERMADVRRIEGDRWRAAAWWGLSLTADRLLREGPVEKEVSIRVDERLTDLARKGLEQMTLGELRHAIDTLRRNGLDAARYEVRYFGQLLYPLYAANLALLGFLVTAQQRVGRGRAARHIALGLVVGVVAYLLHHAVDYALVLYRLGVWEGKLAFQLALLMVNGRLFLALSRI